MITINLNTFIGGFASCIIVEFVLLVIVAIVKQKK